MKSEIFKPTPIEVLDSIWAQSSGSHVFLPRMEQGTWIEGEPWLPRDVTDKLFPGEYEDFYFTPLKYTGPQRKRAFVGNPGVIFADLDGGHREDYGKMPPSVVINTSGGHYHAYWYLEAPVLPDTWEVYAKGWTQEIGADPAGWDITQVLRVPGTFNTKYGDPRQVTIQNFRPDRKYRLNQFPRAEVSPVLERKPRPSASPSLRGTLLGEGFDSESIPLGARYWLTVTKAELGTLGKIDRSAIMWGIEKSLISAGYTIEEVYQLMYFTAINKWSGDPEKLWGEIIKAASTV